MLRRKRSFSSSECPDYRVRDGRSVGTVSASPPFKRATRMIVPSPDLNSSSPKASLMPSNPASTLQTLIREAHSQYHDRLRELRRDCQLMARHYLQQRDDKISFYTRNLSGADGNDVNASVATDTDLTCFDLDIGDHARVARDDL